MPCLMYKVRIARNGVYFTVNLLELGVRICQILQLSRADKGEISRVEEEYTPLSYHICLGNGLKGSVLVSLYMKIAELLSES